ncbi:long-chain-fatty-acid--CoA ligase [Oceanobacillus kapialis]|uniref:long-chain-fatty-acid--CoA ligase n=1 Tax=Oceanobacillus kapialis TaxID=481353 RepID=UPI00384D1B04
MNVSDQLSITAKENPAKIAYFFEEEETSYLELESAVQRFASSMEALGYQKGDHVALIVGNSPYYVISLYGALRLGLVVIPINPMYTANELSYILHNGDVKAIITMDIMLEKLASIDQDLPSVKHYIVCASGATSSGQDEKLQSKIKAFTELIGNGKADFNGPMLSDQDTAIILYTSGTTGKPKGAVLSHQNIYSNAKDVADYLQINGNDRMIAALPMFHVFCLTVALNAPLMNGGTILILPKFSPADVLRVANNQEATVFAGVPTMYNYLLQAVKGEKPKFGNVRLCISGGAAMPVSLLKAFEDTFQIRLSEGYGLSEASPVTCFNPIDRPRKAGSIGTSIWNVENKVVNMLGEEVETGEVGELIVRGPNVMKGYYKLPEETEVALKDGWLYTGDMARVDEDGYFYIVDRKKDMILVGGYNVYPREVEEVLYTHPSVIEVAVIGEPHPESGESVTCFAVIDDPEITEQVLRDYCKGHLVAYKIPTRIEFLEELPKNTTGKILRRRLKSSVKS